VARGAHRDPPRGARARLRRRAELLHAVIWVEAPRREPAGDSARRLPPRFVDGLPPGEGAFLPCTFWLVDNLALQGRLEEAEALFQQLLDLRSDLGLLAEEWDASTRRQLGNFPQAFTHVALVNTAFNLDRQEEASPIEQRAPHEQPTGY
jgi:hypothetical protein